jgi:hypothetical protein
MGAVIADVTFAGSFFNSPEGRFLAVGEGDRVNLDIEFSAPPHAPCGLDVSHRTHGRAALWYDNDVADFHFLDDLEINVVAFLGIRRAEIPF